MRPTTGATYRRGGEAFPIGLAPLRWHVPADAPTVLATSGGFRGSARLAWEVGPLTRFAVELAGVAGRAPRVCFVATASGDNPRFLATFYDNA